MYKVEIDPEECIGCGECEEICPSDVFELQDEKAAPVNEMECLGCESCIVICEQNAITIKETGDIYF